LSFGKKEEHIFLGKEMAQRRDFSEETAELIDSEIKGIVMENYTRAKDLLKESIDVLHRLAEALLEKEVLGTEEIDRIIFGKGISSPPTPVSAVSGAISDPDAVVAGPVPG
ncbi:MAG: cell division protein FtsH, partial [Deltaproteobacteria bacterium]|nr:cell division protein FtsH [Deltaproteobacteria bacterium]